MDVEEDVERDNKSLTRRKLDDFVKNFGKMKARIEEMEEVIGDLQNFSDSKKNMFLAVRRKIDRAKNVLLYMKLHMPALKMNFVFLEGNLQDNVGETVTETKKRAGRGVVASKRSQTEEDAVETLSPHYGKKVWEPTLSPVKANT